MDNIIANNEAGGSGSGGEIDRPNGQIINNVVINNLAAVGGGIDLWYGNVILKNNIISLNSALKYLGLFGEGGGIYSGRATVTIMNCILWENYAYSGNAEIYLFEPAPGDLAVTYSDIQGGWEGIGNIDAAPMLVNPGLDDYHLQFGSPCIDAGTNEDAPDTDLDGNPRPFDGDRDGVAVTDIGAYEFMLPVASFEWNPHRPLPLQSATFNASSSYSPYGNIVSYEWDFGDGNITTVTDPIVVHKYGEKGNYTVALNVTDDEGLWNLASKQMLVTILGDVNGDGVVDIFDVVLAALAFDSRPGDSNWNQAADVNNDDIIDIFDIVTVTLNFGKTA